MSKKVAFALLKSVIVGGTTSVGIDPSSKYLMVVSHSGRGLFKLSDGRRVARDNEVFGPWYYGAQAQGFGPLHGVSVPIFGFGSETPRVVLQYLERNGIEYRADELRGVAISTDHTFVIVGYPDEVEIYKAG